MRDQPSSRLRLFCLPYAGAGAAVFHEWTSLLPRSIHVCPFQLPGRETRLAEPPYTSMAPLVEELASAVDAYLDKPFALFGHSLGGVIAFELARALRRRGRTLPLRLFVSASRPPHRAAASPIAGLPADLFLSAVQQRYDGIPSEVLQSREWLDLVLPILRADHEMIETYRCGDEAPLACPISAFGGADDPAVRRDDLMEWNRYTTRSFDASILPGGHFYIRDSRRALLRTIEDRLDPAN